MNKESLRGYTNSKGFHYFHPLSTYCVSTAICQGRGKSRIQDFVYDSVVPLFPCVYILAVGFHVSGFCESDVLRLGHKSQKMVLKDSLFISKMLGGELTLPSTYFIPILC